MVKKSIQANFQKNTTALTATDANLAPSRSNQRAQPQRPVYTTQAHCPQPGRAESVPGDVSDFLTIRVDFLLTAKRDLAAARHFRERAINLQGLPEKITIDKSSANTAAIESVNTDACVDILMRQNEYLNNIIQQDHPIVKIVTQPMLGFKSFWSARIPIGSI